MEGPQIGEWKVTMAWRFSGYIIAGNNLLASFRPGAHPIGLAAPYLSCVSISVTPGPVLVCQYRLRSGAEGLVRTRRAQKYVQCPLDGQPLRQISIFSCSLRRNCRSKHYSFFFVLVVDGYERTNRSPGTAGLPISSLFTAAQSSPSPQTCRSTSRSSFICVFQF